MDKNRGIDVRRIIELGESVVGKTFGELGEFSYNLDDANYKGGFGVLMEENVFGIEANSDPNPDFYEANIELKTTPVKQNKNGTYSAKERLVLNIINYMEEYKNSFYNSSFWNKNETLFLMFYLWEEGVDRKNYRIIKALLFEYPEEDLIIIKQDWEFIIKKIKEGKAHEISEADTMYLGACSKGKDKTSLRKQPFSDIMAMQRAYCLKNSYMTYLVRTKVMKCNETERLSSASELLSNSFENVLFQRIKPYLNKSQEELIKRFNLNPKSKDVNEKIFAGMLGIHGKVNDAEEFQKANIKCKTVRVNENLSITENMSFPAFKFKEIIKEEWEESTLRTRFTENKYLFVIFKEKNKRFYFSGFKFWNMPLSILDVDIKDVWEKTVSIIKEGNIVKERKVLKSGNFQLLNNFPKMTENEVAHVRPHARVAADCYELPVPDKLTGMTKYTKQCFWLNNEFVAKIINDGSK